MMKKIRFKYSWISLLVCLVFACSYDDKSIYVEELLPEIIIDTTGVSNGAMELRLHRDSLLSIHPKIIFQDATEEDFEYEWRLGLELNGTAPDIGEYMVLSTEKDLDWIVDVYGTPDYKYIPLWFRVKHKKTGMLASVRWILSVKAEVPEGMVVIDTEDDRTCDFSVVRDSVFTNSMSYLGPNNLARSTSYNRNIYSRTHGGQKFDGIVKGIFHQKLYKGSELVHYMHGFTDNNRVFRMDTYNFDIVAEDNELFYDPDIKFNIDNYCDLGYSSNVSAFLINDGKLYKRENERNGAIVISKFGNPLVMEPGCRIPAQVVGYERMVFLSEEDGKFYKVYISDYQENVAPTPYDTATVGVAFDPTKMQGYKNVAVEMYGASDYRFVLKKDGKYYFCTLNNSGPGEFYDLSDAPEIDKAVSFAIGKNAKFIWYATPDKLYIINYTVTGSLQYKVFYDPEEPITNVWLNKGSVDAPYTMSNRNSSLLVTTWDGKEGKLHWLQIGISGDIYYGNRFAPGVAVFDGFKKIVAVANIW